MPFAIQQAEKRETKSHSLPAWICQDRLDIDDGCSIDRFQVVHPQAALLFDAEHFHSVQPHRVGPVGRTGRKNACKGIRGIMPRMDLQDVTLGLMEPGKHENF